MINTLVTIFEELLNVIPSLVRDFSSYAGSLSRLSKLLVQLLNIIGL